MAQGWVPAWGTAACCHHPLLCTCSLVQPSSVQSPPVDAHRVSPRHLPLHRCQHCKGIQCTCMPPVSWDETGDSPRAKIPLPLAFCLRMHVRCSHLRSSFLGSLPLSSLNELSTTEFRMQQPLGVKERRAPHTSWASASVKCRALEVGACPTPLWSTYLWTKRAYEIGRSGFQLPIAPSSSRARKTRSQIKSGKTGSRDATPSLGLDHSIFRVDGEAGRLEKPAKFIGLPLRDR